MILTGGIHIVPQDDRQPVDLRFALAEADVVILQKFLVEVDYLNKSIASIGGFNASLSLSCSVPNKVSFENTEPNEDQRAIILHRLRPIILKKEPHSFDAICAIIHSSTQSDFMSNHLRAIRKIYLGKELLQTFQLSHGEMVLNSENIH